MKNSHNYFNINTDTHTHRQTNACRCTLKTEQHLEQIKGK